MSEFNEREARVVECFKSEAAAAPSQLSWRVWEQQNATLTAEVDSLRSQVSRLTAELEEFNRAYYFAEAALSTSRETMRGVLGSLQKTTGELERSRKECERLREVMTKAARMNMQARGPLEITDILHAALSAGEQP